MPFLKRRLTTVTDAVSKDKTVTKSATEARSTHTIEEHKTISVVEHPTESAKRTTVTDAISKDKTVTKSATEARSTHTVEEHKTVSAVEHPTVSIERITVTDAISKEKTVTKSAPEVKSTHTIEDYRTVSVVEKANVPVKTITVTEAIADEKTVTESVAQVRPTFTVYVDEPTVSVITETINDYETVSVVEYSDARTITVTDGNEIMATQYVNDVRPTHTIYVTEPTEVEQQGVKTITVIANEISVTESEVKPTHTVYVVEQTEFLPTVTAEVIERYETIVVERHVESPVTIVTNVPTVYLETLTVAQACTPVTVTPTVTAAPITVTVTQAIATVTSTVTASLEDSTPKPTVALCENGAYKCVDSGFSPRFTVCANGKLDEYHCAAGTVCKDFQESIVCDWPTTQ
ncbi:hypothetical protein K7432_017425 [Basidiobolus ranarum]|uniref:Chitin-binding type-2 domain-containing protein n=1 Tax=Basidiobolus ranarum TaxID=34480 RepID=A0ABR2WDD3_9FUNG